MKQTSTERPLALEYSRGMNGQYAIVRFNIVEVEEGYEYDEASITTQNNPLTDEDYAPLVSAIVREEYTQDDVEAIMNNYLADPEGHKADFDELQAWRVKAKEVAREIIDATKHNS